MKKLFLILLVLGFFIFPILPTNAYVSVKGYYRKNGTYVAPYVRSNPNGLKYDNYSYTPDQGLYNPTYGTRGTTWDTPTYITDPNYYQGKAIYDLNNGTNTNTSTNYTYTQPAPTATTNTTNLFYAPTAVNTTKTFNGHYDSNNKFIFSELLDKNLIVGREIKGITDPATYVGDSNGCLRWMMNENVAKRLFGNTWNQYINWIDDSLVYSYKMCDPIYE